MEECKGFCGVEIYGGTSTHTSIHHKYAVHCHDGRKFVFDDTLNRVEDLAEKIEVEVVRRGGTVK